MQREVGVKIPQKLCLRKMWTTPLDIFLYKLWSIFSSERAFSGDRTFLSERGGSKKKLYISSTPTSFKTRFTRGVVNFYHFINSENSRYYLSISVFFSLVFILPMIPMFMFYFAEKTPSINPGIYKYLYQNANQNMSTTTEAEPTK